MGEITSSLFGIPSPSNASALQAVDDKLASVVEGVVETQSKVIVKVHIMGGEHEQIKSVVNEVTEHQNTQDKVIKFS